MNLAYTDGLLRVFERLKRRDIALFRKVQKKINQIALLEETALLHFKNLRGSMNHLRRVHIGGFVLTFQVKEGKIIFEDLEHHDKAYVQ